MSVTVFHGVAPDGDDGGIAARLGLVEQSIAALSAVSFGELPLADQAQAVEGLVRLRSRLEAVEAAALASFDSGGEWALWPPFSRRCVGAPVPAVAGRGSAAPSDLSPSGRHSRGGCRPGRW